jgi:large subunit ribosomal protein L25
MATATATSLQVQSREAQGSRAARRLRRSGKVPGSVYGEGGDPVSFQVDSRELRLALAHAGAVIELTIDGGNPTPVVLKEMERHPVSGDTMHIDLLRVRLDQAITATTVVELIGADDAPGIKEGGVLEQVTREISIEALPTDIPDMIELDVSEVVIGDTLTIEALRPPSGVTILTEPETVIATVTPPKLQIEEEPEIEEETELVEGEVPEGEEGEEAAEGEGQAEGGGEGEGGGE